MSSINEAVILAAGFSSRLSNILNGRSKAILSIRDIPLILYPTYSLYVNGIKKFCYVVNRWNKADIASILSKFHVSDFCIITNDYPEKGNGYSFLLSKKCVRGEYFILSMVDHIYHPNIVKKLTYWIRGKYDLIIGGDSDPKYIEVSEATKILYDGNRIVKIGKNLDDFTHIDIGLFVIRKRLLEELKFRRVKKLEFSNIIKKVSDLGYRVKVVDIKGDYWTEVDTGEDLYEINFGIRSEVVEAVQKVLYEKLPFMQELLDELKEEKIFETSS